MSLMTFVLESQFLKSVFNVKAIIGTFNKEKAIGKGDCEIFANLRLSFVWSSVVQGKVA